MTAATVLRKCGTGLMIINSVTAIPEQGRIVSEKLKSAQERQQETAFLSLMDITAQNM